MTDLNLDPTTTGPVVETHPTSAASLLDTADPHAKGHVRFTTGFNPLDDVLDGGIHPGELVIVGGRPGVGKTITTLQWARSMATGGFTVIYVSYEHEERLLLERLLMLEVRGLAGDDEEAAQRLRGAVRRLAFGDAISPLGPEDAELLQRAAARVRSYADRLLLVRASGSHTRTGDMRSMVADQRTGDTVVFVDYLQKVPNGPDPVPEPEHIARVAGGLKDLALVESIAIVAIASTDRVGLTVPRARLHHLRGSEAIAYEADVVVMLNEKATAVSKAHRAYDPVRARTFKNRVVFSVEKNRRGVADVDLDFAKDFSYSRFDPEGAYVAERLADDLLDEE